MASKCPSSALLVLVRAPNDRLPGCWYGRQLKTRDEQLPEPGARRDRASRLSAAILRFNGSLDVGTVLQEVADSARALTGARFGIITTIDEKAEAQDFVTSGFTAAERRQMEQWEDGPRLFEHFRDLEGVVRLDDLPAYVRSLGFSAEIVPSNNFQGTPMRHRGVHVGNFFLAEKQGGDAFTDEDEEVLVLFASQAAAAIANARTHRDEQRTRADLEALVETCPIGVVVFDARTGKPSSYNREAARIVEDLMLPDRSLEHLLEVVTCRRSDGREVSLGEFPIAQAFVDAETVRAEEVELSVPGGRSVTTLINATPIRSGQDEVISVVITMQNLAPLRELDRMRSQFLSMVSHELRTPLAAIKGSTTSMLNTVRALDPVEAKQFFRVIDEQADNMRGLIGDLLDVGRIDTGTLSVSLEPAVVAEILEQARTAFLRGGSSHTVSIDLPRDLPLVTADRQRIVQVLNNLLSNAARHSPRSSPIRIAAVHDGSHVAISVSDGGRGVPEDLLPHLFRKHANHGGDGSGDLRGSGLGLSICKGLVEAHGGRIWAASAGPGQGAQFTFTIPIAEQEARGGMRGRSLSPGTATARVPILVVDDDPHTLRFLREALRSAGYSPILTAEHRDLSEVIKAEKPHLILLDLMLPGADGIALMESVPEMADVPVIFISAYGRDETIARALETGAADYLVKPFSPTELTARIRAALRKRPEPERFVLGDLVIEYEWRKVTVEGRRVRLTATEYELLRILSVNAGRVVTYRALIRQIWRDPDRGDADRVRAFVTQVRRKLGDEPARPTYILNERAVGYRMAAPQER